MADTELMQYHLKLLLDLILLDFFLHNYCRPKLSLYFGLCGMIFGIDTTHSNDPKFYVSVSTPSSSL